jgi:RNA recognition motif-containing protein
MVKIFVGGFPPDTEEIELVQWIAIYGEVCTIKIVRDKKTKKSKGFAFLEMANRAAAERVVDELNGTLMNKRELTINVVEEAVK